MKLIKLLINWVFLAVILGMAIPARAQCDDDYCLTWEVYNIACDAEYQGPGTCWTQTYYEYGSFNLWINTSASCGPDPAPLSYVFTQAAVATASCGDTWEIWATDTNGNYNTYNDYEEEVYLGWVQSQATASDYSGGYGSWSEYYYEDCEGNTDSNSPPWQTPC